MVAGPVFQARGIHQIAFARKDHVGDARDFCRRIGAVAVERHDDVAAGLVQHAAHGAAVALGRELPDDARAHALGDFGRGVAAASRR